MVFVSTWQAVPEDLKETIKLESSNHGAWTTAQRYASEIGMTPGGLYNILKAYNSTLSNPPPKKTAGRHKEEKKPKKLNEQEIDFLKRLETGQADITEASKFVAVSVFKKMLEYPDDVKYIDFFRTELLKLKQEELKIKDTWTKEIILRMFAGKMPPPLCPKCGAAIGTQKVIEAVIDDGRLSQD
jgi:hypothetical protein